MAHLPSQYERFEIGIDHSFQILNLNFYSRRMRWFVFVARKCFCKNLIFLDYFDIKNKF